MGGSATILLVEDNSSNQRLMTAVIERMGHCLLIAHNGAHALELFGRHTVDLVLMDIQMPHMDGYECARRIRTLEAGTSTPVPIIAITAHVFDNDRQYCLNAGMDDFLPKPLTVAVLRDRITQWLKGRSSERLDVPQSPLEHLKRDW